jgi:class IIb bacteriocin, lactobin A/cerein 7B family
MTLVIIILKIEKENWMVLNLENVNCVTLQDEELMMVNGGLAPIVIGGVVVGWKVIGGVAGVIAASGAAGIAAGYYANRP